jgi:hypothetical protein
MPETKKKTKYLSILIRFLIAAIALYFAFREKPRETLDTLLSVKWWIWAAALVIYIISQLIFVARWYLLLWVQSIRIGYWPAVRLHFLGLFYNNCLPSSVGGDLLRAWYVTKHTDKKVPAVMSVFVDRAVGLTGTILMAVGCYWFIPEQGRSGAVELPQQGSFWDSLLAYKWVLAGAAAVFVLCLVLLLLHPNGRDLVRRGLRFVEEHGLRLWEKGRESIHIYYKSKLAILAAMGLTFACQGLFIIGIWLIGRDIGVDAHFKYYFIFFPISWVIGMLPISVGGAGITELWLKEMFIRVCQTAVGDAQALAGSQRILWLGGSLPGVVIHLLGAHLPGEPKYKSPLGASEEFSVDYKSPVN